MNRIYAALLAGLLALVCVWQVSSVHAQSGLLQPGNIYGNATGSQAPGQGNPPGSYTYPGTATTFTQAGTGAVQTTVQDNDRLYLNVLQFIPTTEWAAIKAKTSTLDVSSYINAAITAAASTNKGVFFPCGSYLVKATLVLLDNTGLRSDGYCSSIVFGNPFTTYAPWSALFPSDPKRMMVTNENYTGGNVNLFIEGLYFDISNAASIGGNSADAIFLYKVTTDRISKNIFFADGGPAGDAVAHVHSSQYVVSENQATGFNNACYDQWDGSTYISVVNNDCVTSGSSASFGVVLTGTGTTAVSSPLSHFVVQGNHIVAAGGNAIWMQGGLGLTSDGVAADNVVEGGTPFGGIRCSDCARITIANNTIRNVAGSAIAVNSEAAGGGTDVTISDNVISGNGASSAIFVGNASTHVLVSGNVVGAGSQTYSLNIDTGSTQVRVSNNYLTAGSTAAYVNNGGSSNCIQDIAPGSGAALGATSCSWEFDGNGFGGFAVIVAGGDLNIKSAHASFFQNAANSHNFAFNHQAGGFCGAYDGGSNISCLSSTGVRTVETWNGVKIGVAYGGTNSDLSATGGTSQVLMQTSVGGNITAAQLAASNLSNGVTGSGAVVLASAPAISGGTIDNAVIGGTTKAAGSFTAVTGTSYTVGATAGASCTLTLVSHLTVVNGIVTLCN